MKYYKNKNNDIYAYNESLTRTQKSEKGLTLITEEDVKAILNPPLSDEQLKEQAINNANNEYETAISQIKASTPKSEVETWTKQEIEARAYMAEDSTTTPLIDALAISRGIDKDVLVAKIIEKANAYATAVGTLTGARQAKIEEIENQ